MLPNEDDLAQWNLDLLDLLEVLGWARVSGRDIEPRRGCRSTVTGRPRSTLSGSLLPSKS